MIWDVFVKRLTGKTRLQSLEIRDGNHPIMSSMFSTVPSNWCDWSFRPPCCEDQGNLSWAELSCCVIAKQCQTRFSHVLLHQRGLHCWTLELFHILFIRSWSLLISLCHYYCSPSSTQMSPFQNKSSKKLLPKLNVLVKMWSNPLFCWQKPQSCD